MTIIAVPHIIFINNGMRHLANSSSHSVYVIYIELYCEVFDKKKIALSNRWDSLNIMQGVLCTYPNFMRVILISLEVTLMLYNTNTIKQIQQIPIYEKYNLTITEAAQYFNIGEKNLRKIVANDPTADYILTVGNKVLIKRKLFEQFIDETSSI